MSYRCGCGLTPRSSGAPTAGHQARSGGTRYIFASPGLASCRRRPLSSNVRRRVRGVSLRLHRWIKANALASFMVSSESHRHSTLCSGSHLVRRQRFRGSRVRTLPLTWSVRSHTCLPFRSSWSSCSRSRPNPMQACGSRQCICWASPCTRITTAAARSARPPCRICCALRTLATSIVVCTFCHAANASKSAA